jgi:hypothetical protein
MSEPFESPEDESRQQDAYPGLLPGGTLDPVFRSGSLTAISVVLGFSLSFLNRWAGAPGDWQVGDIVSLALIICGTSLQLKALVDLLLLNSLLPIRYRRSIKYFFAGLALVAIAILVAVIEDVMGFGLRILGG